MSLETNLQTTITRIATENKSLRTLINGNSADLSALTTSAKGNLVAAVNELQAEVNSAAGGGVAINDAVTTTTDTWSSSKIDATIDTDVAVAVANLVNSAPTTLDTLGELAAELQDQDSDVAAITTALGVRVSVADPQTFTEPQKAQGRSNIGAGTSSLVVGTTATDAKAGNWLPTAADISNSTLVGRNVLTATDAAAARTAIGAGTSDLVIGTIAGTAKAGNYTPPNATTGAVGLIQLAGDLAGTATAPTVRAASETVAGKVELATAAETTTGTDTVRAVHPAGLKAVADTKAPLTHTHTVSQLSDSTAVGRSVLTAPTAADARTAIGAQDATAIGNTEVDLVAVFNAALV
jgi:hypothetical protein